ncbi:MAG: hypothetical protein ACSHYB_19600 [Roseibacillus sp.]
MKTIALLFIVGSMLLIGGCKSKGSDEFSMSAAQIKNQQKEFPGVFFASRGSLSDEPFKETMVVPGVVGGEISIAVGGVSLVCPAAAGYYYEGRAYLNSKNKGYIVARKIEDPAP